MENIILTNNKDLRLVSVKVGVLSTLRFELPLVSASATHVEVIVTSGNVPSAYTATFIDATKRWQCDIAASQFPTVGRQSYEIAYVLDGKQFWDGKGWIEIEDATTSGIEPQPRPEPYRYAVVSVNGYGADAQGAVRIPKTFITTDSPETTEGYIEGDIFFNRETGATWTLCNVQGTLTWVFNYKNYYTKAETEEAIDRVAAYYITYDAAGNPFPTYAALANAQTVYSGGAVRVPTRNDYCVVLADETHQGAEYRYIYAVAEGQTTGSWQAQFPVEGVMTIDQTVIRNSANPVAGGGVWSMLWGALSALPTGFTSLYDWVVSQLAKYLPLTGGTMTGGLTVPNLTVGSRKAGSTVGMNSVAEGNTTTASGTYSHAEGNTTTASGAYSHAEGVNTTASGADSHAEGFGTTAQNQCEHAQGRYNVTHKASNTFGDAGNTLSSIGCSTSNLSSNRKNAVETMQDGKTFIYGLGGYDGTNPTDATDLATSVNGKASRVANPTTGNLAALDANGNPVDSGVKPSDKLDSTSAAPAFSPDPSVSYAVGSHCTYQGKLYKCTTATTGGTWVAGSWTADAITDIIPYDRITITTGQLQDHAEQKVTLNAATTTLSLPALTDLTGKVADFGIDVVNAYTPEVGGTPTPTAASFSLAGTIGTDYNLIVPEGEDWSEMSALAAGEMAVYYFTLSAFQINDKPTWEVMKKVVELVPVPVAP